MLIITIAFAVGLNVLYHPVGFTSLYTIVSPIGIANSILQLASFAPPAGAPPGPVEEARLALKCAMRFAVRNFNGEGGSTTMVAPESDNLVSEHNSGRIPSKKLVFVRSHRTLSTTKKVAQGNAWFIALENSLEGRRLSRGWLPMLGVGRGGSSQALFSNLAEAPGQTPTTGCQKYNTQDELAPCDRMGISLLMLEAFVTHYDITSEMTTTDVCDQYIKPYTRKRKCCYIDLLVEEDPTRPEGWVGKTTHFASHWWGYSFLAVLEMLRAHSARLKAAGLPRAFYFFDAFTVNQHTCVRVCEQSNTRMKRQSE